MLSFVHIYKEEQKKQLKTFFYQHFIGCQINLFLSYQQMNNVRKLTGDEKKVNTFKST